MGKLGPLAAPASSALANALSDPVAEVRASAAWAIGRIGPAAKDAVPALRKALEDPDEQVRDDARKALETVLGGN